MRLVTCDGRQISERSFRSGTQKDRRKRRRHPEFWNKQVNELRFAKPQQRQCSRDMSRSARRRKGGDRSAFREILAETPGRGAADDGIALGQSSGLVRLWALSPCSALPTNTRTEYE